MTTALGESYLCNRLTKKNQKTAKLAHQLDMKRAERYFHLKCNVYDLHLTQSIFKSHVFCFMIHCVGSRAVAFDCLLL